MIEGDSFEVDLNCISDAELIMEQLIHSFNSQMKIHDKKICYLSIAEGKGSSPTSQFKVKLSGKHNKPCLKYRSINVFEIHDYHYKTKNMQAIRVFAVCTTYGLVNV